jgi:sugar transferase (PEP-CTERM/EpsH1 system associated)
VKKIRVVHAVHSFGTGGLEKGIATVIRHGTIGFEHVVLCFSRSGESARLLPDGTRVIELHKPEGNSLSYLLRLARTLRGLGPAVVHTRNWGGMDAIIAARLAGIRTVVQGEHGWGTDDADGSNPKRVRVRRFLSRWVREYTCVSRQIEQWLMDEVRVGRPVTQVYNGVDTGLYAPFAGGDRGGTPLRQELGIPGDAFVAGIVGRLDPIKDHLTLFRAFDMLKARHPKSFLVVVGDGPERGRLERAAGEGVIFLGNRQDVTKLMGALDVFVLPSLNEGISNTILEAMASGLPVVATAVGGNPELVVDGCTGTLFPVGDAERLAGCLASYAEEPAMGLAQGEAGRCRVVEQFSIEAMVRGYEQVWQRVGGGGQ